MSVHARVCLSVGGCPHIHTWPTQNARHNARRRRSHGVGHVHGAKASAEAAAAAAAACGLLLAVCPAVVHIRTGAGPPYPHIGRPHPPIETSIKRIVRGEGERVYADAVVFGWMCNFGA